MSVDFGVNINTRKGSIHTYIPKYIQTYPQTRRHAGRQTHRHIDIGFNEILYLDFRME